MKISVIHPSRNRPERASKVFKEMITKADKPELIEYIISIDNDEIKDYTNISSGIFSPATLVSDNRYCVGAINNGAKASSGDILMVASDDFDEWPKGWDNLIREVFKSAPMCFEVGKGIKPTLLKTNDGSQGWIATLPIMNRELYNKLGYIYNPEYLHMFCDTDLSSICDLMDCTIYRLDIMFRHNHYTKLKNKDSINERNDATWNQGEAIYLRRWRENFGLHKSEIIGRIRDERHKDWVRRKLNG
jgi:glycosyltransferase involved in cell wall biosynthesis